MSRCRAHGGGCPPLPLTSAHDDDDDARKKEEENGVDCAQVD